MEKGIGKIRLSDLATRAEIEAFAIKFGVDIDTVLQYQEYNGGAVITCKHRHFHQGPVYSEYMLSSLGFLQLPKLTCLEYVREHALDILADQWPSHPFLPSFYGLYAPKTGHVDTQERPMIVFNRRVITDMENVLKRHYFDDSGQLRRIDTLEDSVLAYRCWRQQRGTTIQ